MPELKALYDSADDIPESVEDFRALFTEKNGKHELTGISGVQTPANVARLETSLSKERLDHKATKDKLGVWGDLKHDDVVASLDRIPELEAAGAGKLDDAKIEEIVNRRVEGVIKSKLSPLERANKKLLEGNAELTTANEGFTVANTRRTIGDDVRRALVKAKVVPEAHDDALMLGERVFEVTEDGNVVTRDNVGVPPGLDADGWLTEIQDKKPHWWPASVSGGALGSRGPGTSLGGKNPWSAAAWNMTEQGRYLRANGTEKAKRMAEAAGSHVGAASPAKTTS